MAIYGYVGKPGAGKSYLTVAEVIVPALKAGRVVYHNMQLREAELRALCGHGGRLVSFDPDCTAEELCAGAPPGALVVIDESVRYWPAGTKANRVPPDQLEFFTKHRHRVGDDGRATDIVVICQELGSQCAAFIRELVEFTYRAVKLSALGMSNRYRVEVYEGAVKGDRPPQSRLVRKTVGRYDKRFFRCYVSHTQSRRGVAGEELRDSRASVWRSWQVYAAGCALLLCPLMVWASIHEFRNLSHVGSSRARRAEHSEASRAAEPATGTPVAHPVAAAPRRPAVSDEWRVAGVIRIGRLVRVVLQGDSFSRVVPVSACRRDAFRQWTCHVDGQVVTEWSGPAPAGFNQWFQSSASPRAAVDAK